MPTRITQLEDTERGKTILRVEGEMTFDDAVLLEKIALEMKSAGAKNITLDLADLDLLDSDSAPILMQMKSEHGFEIEGIEYFLQTMIDQNERRQNQQR